MTLFPGSIYGGIAQLGASAKAAAAIPWHLTGGIAAATCNVVEDVTRAVS